MDIYNRKNEMRREIYSEMLKKGQQKPSTRLYDRVIVGKSSFVSHTKHIAEVTNMELIHS